MKQLRAGNVEGPHDVYRQVHATYPVHRGALHMLGVVSLQSVIVKTRRNAFVRH
jgi:hypothetical protein